MALLLTGCSTGASGGSISEDASGEACAVEGAASKSIEVDGKFGEAVTLTSKTPITVGDKIERTVITEGDSSKPFAEGQVTTATYTIFNGKTGEVVNSAPQAKIANDPEALVGADWALEAVRCGAVGQRTAIVTTVDDALGGADPAEGGFADLKKTDAFVFVFDFTAAEEVVEPCEKLTPRDEKFPEVDLGDGKSEPKITIPECMEPPAEFELKVLEQGDGAVIKEGDVVMTNYLGVDWNGAVRFDGNWTAEGFRLDTNGVIQGFKDAMVGQKLGTTVLVTMPSDLGYNDGMTRTFVMQLISLTE